MEDLKYRPFVSIDTIKLGCWTLDIPLNVDYFGGNINWQQTSPWEGTKKANAAPQLASVTVHP